MGGFNLSCHLLTGLLLYVDICDSQFFFSNPDDRVSYKIEMDDMFSDFLSFTLLFFNYWLYVHIFFQFFLCW